MAKAKDILGLNAREVVYLARNKRKALVYARSKLAAKRLMQKHGILVPSLYAVFENKNQVYEYDFGAIKTSFVVKPIGGNAGKGILIVRRKGKKKTVWVDPEGRVLKLEDVRLHIDDILEGLYSTYGQVHKAFLEEWVATHPKFKKYSYKGTPDVRVIVYNRVPVMAMLRLPTRESGGRANLHQGAIGVGVDMSSGVTLMGVWRRKQIKYLPGTKRKLNGLRIPQWSKMLKTAVRAVAVAGFDFCGVDLFIHKEKGPMVVELNANPGLDIQLANNDGLRRRLERVEGLKILDEEHGVKVGRALFAEWFADKVKAEDGLVVVDSFEKVELRSSKKKWVETVAKIDTGAYRTAVDKSLAESLGLMDEGNILWVSKFRNVYGAYKRPVVELKMRLKGRRIKTAASVVDRSKMSTKVLIGRRDLSGFLVNPVLKKDKK